MVGRWYLKVDIVHVTTRLPQEEGKFEEITPICSESMIRTEQSPRQPRAAIRITSITSGRKFNVLVEIGRVQLSRKRRG